MGHKLQTLSSVFQANSKTVNLPQPLSSVCISRFAVLKTDAKFSLCLTKHRAMKMYWGAEVLLHAFLTLALDGGEWSAFIVHKRI